MVVIRSLIASSLMTMAPTGFADDAPAYNSSETASPYTTLKLGSTGDAVTALQNRLIELGYLSEDDITLGKYEKATRDAVIDAQLARTYESDGTADSDFQTYIYSDEVYDYIDNPEGDN